MSVNLGKNSNFKYIMLSLVAQRQSLWEEFTKSMIPSFHESDKFEDFGDYIGYVALKGNKLENFLRDRGVWYELHGECRELMSSTLVEDALLAEDPSFKSLRWKNVTQANAKRIEKASYLMVKPLTRAILKLKQKPENRLNSTLERALLASLGYSELSKGSWCSIASGMSKALSRPVGGKINEVVSGAGVIELSAKLAPPVEKIAEIYSLPLAEPLKKVLSNIKTGVKTAAMCAVMAFTIGVDSVDNSSVLDSINKFASEATFLSEGVVTGASELAALEEKYPNEIKSEKLQGYALDLPDSKLELADSAVGSDFVVEQYEPSFDEKLKGESDKFAKKSYTAASGDNMWSISESVVADLTSGFGALVDDTGSPSELTVLVSAVHQKLIKANGLENPDLILEGQKISIGDEVAALLDASLDQRIDFVADIIKPEQNRVLSVAYSNI